MAVTTLALKVRLYMAKFSTRAYTLIGTRYIYIPKGSSTFPSNTQIMANGYVVSGYNTVLNWCPQFNLLCAYFARSKSGYPNGIPYPHFVSQFPKVEVFDTTAYDTILAENVANGRVMMLSSSATSTTYFYASLTDYQNNTAYTSGTNLLMGVNINGSGASRGGAQMPFYTSIDPDTGNITGLRYANFTGVISTTNSISTGSSAGTFSSSWVNAFNWFTDGHMVPMGNDPYEDLPVGGDEPIPGGGAVGIPGFPGLTATSAGVIGLFAPSAGQMQQLADFMWTDFGGTGTTVEEVLQEIVEALKRAISNPLDYIIGLNIIPSQGLSVGASKNVRFGFVNSGVSMPVLANQYFTVDCGSLAFDTVCGDTFLDYAPYSKFSIYLPYIGFKDVDPNDFVGHTIGVTYHGDCVTGGVTAYITKDGSVMYQYSGCCALNVPLSADNWGETISAAINVATGIVAAAATGGAAGVAAAAAKGAANVAANPSLLSPQVNHSGAVSGGAGCMGIQYPFVIREAVNFHSTAGFNKSAGYPAYYYKKLGEVQGFTTVIDAHMTNIPMATQDEIQEIEALLEKGVIL